MKRIRGLLSTGAAASSVLLALVSGCTDDNPGFFITGVLAPPASTGGVCTYSADPEAPRTASGILDLAFISSYTPTLLVSSQLLNRADPTIPRVDTSLILMHGAVVSLTETNGNEIRAFTTLGTGQVSGGSGTSGGFGTFTASVIDPESTQILRSSVPARGTKLVLAKFKVFGRTTGGIDVESAEYQLPISVCNGCLVTFPPDSVDQAKQAQTGQPNCSAPFPAAGAAPAPCLAGQDQPIDCRLCQGNPACDPATP